MTLGHEASRVVVSPASVRVHLRSLFPLLSLFLVLSRTALSETDRSGAPTLAPAEIDLGRVYRGVDRVFTFEAESAPGAELTLDVSPPLTATGARAVGVSIRTPGRRLKAGADGKLAVECELSVVLDAVLGPAEAKVSLSGPAGRGAASVVRFVVSQRGLDAPARLDFGEVFIRGSARAELALRVESPDGASAWLEWTGLEGDSAEVLAAFVRVADRAVELPPDADVRAPVEIEIPRGTRPGEYRGRLTVTAGPFRADVELAVRAVLPRMSTDPEVVDLGRAAADELASAGFSVRLDGAAPERFEAEFEGPLTKAGRAAAMLDVLDVETDEHEIAPGEEAGVRVFGTVPAGQEDGTYEGFIILRAGASRRRVPVTVTVPRPEGLAPYELEPLELVIHARRGESTRAALRVRSNVDRGLALEASLTPPGDSNWMVEFDVESSTDGLALVVPARGEAEIPIIARAPEGAPLGERAEARVEVSGGEPDIERRARSDVTIKVARAAPAPEPAKPSPIGRALLAAFALGCALTVAASWKVRPVRYGAASAGVHAVVLAFGVRSPFMSAPARAPGGGPPIAVQVIQLDDPFGEGSRPGAGDAAAGLAPEPEGDTPPESADLGEDEDAGEAAELEPPPAALPGGLAVPIPSHPDAPDDRESRESLEVARAPVRSAGPPAVRDSDGFDLEGPEAVLSILEAGEIRRASLSSEERFGVAARELAPGVFVRGEPNLIEDVPAGALAAAILRPETLGAAPGRTLRTVRAETPVREAADLAAPETREVRRASLTVARRGRVDVPVERTALRPRETGRELPQESPGAAAPERAERTERTERFGRNRRAARPRADTTGPSRPPRPELARPRLPRALTPVRRVRLARETPRLAVPVTRARGGVERPSGSVTESISDGSPEPSARPREAPPETIGRQTITRARGRSTAGVAGRLEQSFSRPGRKPMPLPSIRTPLARTGAGAAASKLLNPSRGRVDRGRVRAVRAGLVFGVLKHSGEWNVSPRAMGVLARELPARQPGFNLDVRTVPVRATEPELLDCALVYVTGRSAPALSERERERLARYIDQGGFIWMDDGAPPGNGTFDRAGRRLLASLVPGATLRRVPFSNGIFTCSYDLARGYLGRALPGGAWVRQDELEGLFTPEGRLVAVYTRNGYGLAMEVDPNRLAGSGTSSGRRGGAGSGTPSGRRGGAGSGTPSGRRGGAGFRPPPGLTPREAREGALRAGVNIAMAALRSSGDPGGEALPEGRAREVFDPSLRYRYRGTKIEPARGAWAEEKWREMRGSGPVKLAGSKGAGPHASKARPAGALVVEFVASEKDWAGVESAAPGGAASARAVVFDIECVMHSPARIALRMRTAGGSLYESVPLYVHPGLNENLRVPLDSAEFRSNATGWRDYDAMPDRHSPPSVIGFVFYGRDLAGSAILDRLRFEGWGQSPR